MKLPQACPAGGFWKVRLCLSTNTNATIAAIVSNASDPFTMSRSNNAQSVHQTQSAKSLTLPASSSRDRAGTSTTAANHHRRRPSLHRLLRPNPNHQLRPSHRPRQKRKRRPNPRKSRAILNSRIIKTGDAANSIAMSPVFTYSQSSQLKISRMLNDFRRIVGHILHQFLVERLPLLTL